MENQNTNQKLIQVLHSWKSNLCLAVGLLMLVGACNEGMFNDDDLNNDLELQTQFLLSKFDKIGISDAAHDGIDEFYFLEQTIGKTPKFNGTFHSNLKPVVEISDDFEFKTFHQVFSRDASGVNQLMVNLTDEFYLANWNTAETKAIKGKIYRIRVRVGERVMGFVDVGIVSPQTKKLGNNIVPLVENQTMKIAFRLEDKICPARIEVLPEEATIPVDGDQQFEAIVYNFYDEVLEDQDVKWMLGDNEIASISSTGLAIGLNAGSVTVFAQSFDVTGTASLIVEEAEDPNTVTDIDGNVYKTVEIGNQIWMAEDLRVTKYNDGTPIPKNWQDTPSMEAYFENPTGKPKAGLLYNLQALFTNKLCPVGWREARSTEWNILISYLSPNVGDKIKSIDGWAAPSAGTNSSGFNALPNGSISAYFTESIPPFGANGGNEWAFWWARQSDQFVTWTIIGVLRHNSPDLVLYSMQNSQANGLCLRCIKN